MVGSSAEEIIVSELFVFLLVEKFLNALIVYPVFLLKVFFGGCREKGMALVCELRVEK